MRVVPPLEPLAITGWGVISSIGIGVAPFATSLQAGRAGRKPISGFPPDTLPFAEACVIPEFEASDFLGKKGTRFLDRTAALAVVTVGMALQESGLVVTAENQQHIGIVLGTNRGSIKSVGDFMRDTLVHERPYMVNPMHFPNSVMNCAAGQSAIWHKLKGMNTTISGGRMAGLLAIRYAGLMIRLGYADVILAGGVEEFCEQTAWGFYHAGRVRPESELQLGEGCAIFAFERKEHAAREGRKILAEVLACEVGVYSSADEDHRMIQANGLFACIKRALERAGIAPEAVEIVSLHQWADPELEEVEEQALRLALPRPESVHRLAISQLVGDCFSAAGAFQLAALLALFERAPAKNGRIGLITSLAHHGSVGCAVIRENRTWRE